ncbi:MAG TPA: hypothetical protein VFN57_08145 [Thermomicrobiaceae bacterium]|nr:hypothetical protein [Thermomicrobiaceae bacterium]
MPDPSTVPAVSGDDTAGVVPWEGQTLRHLRVGWRWVAASAGVVALVVGLAVLSGLTGSAAVHALLPPGPRGTVGSGTFGGRPGLAPVVAIDPTVVAGVLGITTGELRTELTARKTLRQVIVEHGATADRVVSALVDRARIPLDLRVAAGQLTPAQEQRLLAADRRGFLAAIAHDRLGP